MWSERLARRTPYLLSEEHAGCVLRDVSLDELTPSQREMTQLLETVGNLIIRIAFLAHLIIDQGIRDEMRVDNLTAAFARSVPQLLDKRFGLSGIVKRNTSKKPAREETVSKRFVAAVYRERGFAGAYALLSPHFEDASSLAPTSSDGAYRSLVQQYAQARRISLSYRQVSQAGTEHEPTFTYHIRVGKDGATGSGRTKKAAMAAAAKSVSMKLGLKPEGAAPARASVEQGTGKTRRTISRARIAEIESALKALALPRDCIDLTCVDAALTHVSMEGSSGTPGNRGLLLIGAAVINLLALEYLESLTRPHQADIAKAASLLCGDHGISRAIPEEVTSAIRIGDSLSHATTHNWDKIKSDALKAIIAAFWVAARHADGAHAELACRTLAQSVFATSLSHIEPDYTTILQEVTQAYGLKRSDDVPEGFLGPAHKPTYVASITTRASGSTLRSSGQGGSKREALRQAARDMLAQLAPLCPRDERREGMLRRHWLEREQLSRLGWTGQTQDEDRRVTSTESVRSDRRTTIPEPAAPTLARMLTAAMETSGLTQQTIAQVMTLVTTTNARSGIEGLIKLVDRAMELQGIESVATRSGSLDAGRLVDLARRGYEPAYSALARILATYVQDGGYDALRTLTPKGRLMGWLCADDLAAYGLAYHESDSGFVLDEEPSPQMRLRVLSDQLAGSQEYDGNPSRRKEVERAAKSCARKLYLDPSSPDRSDERFLSILSTSDPLMRVVDSQDNLVGYLRESEVITRWSEDRADDERQVLCLAHNVPAAERTRIQLKLMKAGRLDDTQLHEIRSALHSAFRRMVNFSPNDRLLPQVAEVALSLDNPRMWVIDSTGALTGLLWESEVFSRFGTYRTGGATQTLVLKTKVEDRDRALLLADILSDDSLAATPRWHEARQGLRTILRQLGPSSFDATTYNALCDVAFDADERVVEVMDASGNFVGLYSEAAVRERWPIRRVYAANALILLSVSLDDVKRAQLIVTQLESWEGTEDERCTLIGNLKMILRHNSSAFVDTPLLERIVAVAFSHENPLFKVITDKGALFGYLREPDALMHGTYQLSYHERLITLTDHVSEQQRISHLLSQWGGSKVSHDTSLGAEKQALVKHELLRSWRTRAVRAQLTDSTTHELDNLFDSLVEVETTDGRLVGYMNETVVLARWNEVVKGTSGPSVRISDSLTDAKRISVLVECLNDDRNNDDRRQRMLGTIHSSSSKDILVAGTWWKQVDLRDGDWLHLEKRVKSLLRKRKTPKRIKQQVLRTIATHEVETVADAVLAAITTRKRRMLPLRNAMFSPTDLVTLAVLRNDDAISALLREVTISERHASVPEPAHRQALQEKRQRERGQIRADLAMERQSNRAIPASGLHASSSPEYRFEPTLEFSQPWNSLVRRCIRYLDSFDHDYRTGYVVITAIKRCANTYDSSLLEVVVERALAIRSEWGASAIDGMSAVAHELVQEALLGDDDATHRLVDALFELTKVTRGTIGTIADGRWFTAGLTEQQIFELYHQEPVDFNSRPSRDMDYSGLAPESLLMSYGYSVAEKTGLSSDERHDILMDVINDGVMGRHEIIQFLEWLIRSREGNPNLALACERWRSDIWWLTMFRP